MYGSTLIAILKASHCNLNFTGLTLQTANRLHSPLTTSDDPNRFLAEQLSTSPLGAFLMSAHNITACLWNGGRGCSLQSRQHHSRTVLAPARDECQLDFRLRKVKERVTLDLATDGCAAKTEDKTPFNRSRNHNKVMNEIPIRSNGGHQVVRLLQTGDEIQGGMRSKIWLRRFLERGLYDYDIHWILSTSIRSRLFSKDAWLHHTNEWNKKKSMWMYECTNLHDSSRTNRRISGI